MERHQKFAESLWRTKQSVKPCIFFISFYPFNMFFKLYICFVPACSCACRSIMQRAEEKVLGLILAIRLWGHTSSCFCPILHTAGQLERASSSQLFYLYLLSHHKSAGITDVCLHIWMFMWIPKTEFRLPELHY